MKFLCKSRKAEKWKWLYRRTSINKKRKEKKQKTKNKTKQKQKKQLQQKKGEKKPDIRPKKEDLWPEMQISYHANRYIHIYSGKSATGYIPLHILRTISGLNSPRPNYILTQI